MVRFAERCPEARVPSRSRCSIEDIGSSDGPTRPSARLRSSDAADALAGAPPPNFALKLPGTVVGRALLSRSAGHSSHPVGEVAVLDKGPPHGLGIRLIGLRSSRHHRPNIRGA